MYHSFAHYRDGLLPLKTPNVIHKPRTKGFTASSVQFEDGTEASDVDFIVLATGYDYRFPFLDPSDPYHQSSQEPPANGRHSIVTTNASAHSRSRGEQRLTVNLKYLFPLDRHIVSLSSLHPLNALAFIGLPYLTSNSPSDIAQSMFAGHLIAQPERVYPTSHITRQDGWNETLARELLLKDLTAFENRLAREGSDVYRLGHRVNIGSYTDTEYQDSLITHLRTQGLVPTHDGEYIFVEPWRTRGEKKKLELRRLWREIESRGEVEVRRWLDGVETEEEWADLIDRILEWGEADRIQ